MQTFNDVHQQFAEFFGTESLKPYAWLVSKKLSEGHICFDLNEMEEHIEELPLSYKDKIADKKELQNESLVALANEEKQPFILHNDRLYLQRYFNYETIILNRIKELLETEESQKRERLQSLQEHRHFIMDLFKNSHSENGVSSKTDWQIAAAISTALNNFTIITGGPGTGKTTTVAKILAILFKINPELKVALAAPTGKAASRMAESLKAAKLNVDDSIVQKFQLLEPSTIQRLLKFSYGSPYFKHNKNNPLNYDIVIIDESSMLDVALFAKLMDAIGPKTKLILLGDKDQLASVEAGSLFGDLCQAQQKLNLFSEERTAIVNSFISNNKTQITENNVEKNNSHPLFEHVIELRHSHRYSDDKGIGKFSKAVIGNDESVIKTFMSNKDEQVFIDSNYSPELLNQFIKGYENFMLEKDIHQALFKLNKLRVLCAIKEGEHGLKVINQKIEKYLQQKKIINITGAFYENRPVIITQNYYDLNLFNGDIGIVRADENGDLKAWFENSVKELKSFSPTYLTQCETVFAMTIHKSQGSEFDEVMIVLPDSPNISILTRELLYTAVTRARKKVWIQGNEQVILQSAKSFVKRASGIKERFFDQ
jgi:exodeoxyribonuclease V alpha subunit